MKERYKVQAELEARSRWLYKQLKLAPRKEERDPIKRDIEKLWQDKLELAPDRSPTKMMLLSGQAKKAIADLHNAQPDLEDPDWDEFRASQSPSLYKDLLKDEEAKIQRTLDEFEKRKTQNSNRVRSPINDEYLHPKFDILIVLLAMTFFFAVLILLTWWLID